MASTGEGGGVGGKFRKRPFRRSSSQATPYDRPSSALRKPSWLSKLVVDPASKLISFGAQRFFSSIFPSKRLPPPPSPPPQPPEEEQETRNGLQEMAQDICAGVPPPVTNVGDSSTCNDTKGLPELELLLKHKTFTRSEISRLTELLHSRAVDLPVKDDGQGVELSPHFETNLLKPMLENGRGQELTTLSGNNIERLGSQGTITEMKPLEDQIASPAELAKAYMGSRPSKVSPSTSGVRAQLARRDSLLLSNSPSTSKSPISSLAVRVPSHLGVPENGFTTPRSRGRSAIYSMARTPYSRVYPATSHKAGVSTNYGYSRPLASTSQSSWDYGGQVASKPMALKRRSSVLDDDIGSIGPIRRIRQKPNLLSHAISAPSRGRVNGSNGTHVQNLPFVGDANSRGSNPPSTSYAHVPQESSEMAARILDHLEKMTPKEKASESKLAAARERSTFKLTEDMLRGQALRSLEDLDASKLLQNSQKNHKSGDQPSSHPPESRHTTTNKLGRVEEQDPAKSVLPENKLSTDTIIPLGSNKSAGNGVVQKSSTQSSEKKQSFKMSAHEDWLDLDDDHFTLSASKSVEESRTGSTMIDNKSTLNDYTASDKTLVSHEVATLAPLLSGKTESDSGNVAAAGDKGIGFNFSTSVSSTTNSHASVFSQSVLAAEKPTIVDDSPLFFHSGSTTISTITQPVESKAESSSSLKNVLNGATNADSSKHNAKNSELDNTVDGNVEPLPSIVCSSSETSSITSADPPFRNLASNDMPLPSSASLLLSSSAPASVKPANQNFTFSSNNTVSLTSISTTSSIISTSAASSISLLTSKVASSTSSAPGFTFGSTKDLPTPLSAASIIGSKETTDIKVTSAKENAFGNFSNSSPGSTPFDAVSTGSSIFGVGSFASTSVANSQGLGSSSVSGSAVSTESPLAGSGTATVSVSMPVQFGSSSSSTVFVASGVTSSAPSSIFGSATPPTKSDGTVQSSPAPASVTNLVNCNNGAAPGPFKFGVRSTAASEANAVSSTSTASLGTFAFGASPAVSPSSGSSVTPSFFSFGAGSSASSSATSSSSTTPSFFSFGAGSSASLTATCSSSTTNGGFSFGAGSSASLTATSSSSTTIGGFSFGATPLVSSSPANPVTSSSGTAPAHFGLGASTSAPSSDTSTVSSSGANASTFSSSLHAPKSPVFGSPFNSLSSSTGFTFGASSSSFGTSNSSPMMFGSTIVAPSNPIFSFSSATSSSLPSSSTQTAFGIPTTPGNNDQMSTEDSMAEDPVQSSTPPAPVFGQPLASPSPQGFMFGSPAPAAASPFQFGSQQNQAAPQNPTQFPSSGSLEFNAGGSFSLGSGGPDKSGRKIVKVNRNRNRKR